MQIDVFNGDADGICALVQLRLDRPVSSELVTGVKRDIALMEKVSAKAGDQLTVLDISFEKNQQRVDELLHAGASIFYVDHHKPGAIPSHPNLKTIINTDSSVCTSLLVNQYLNNKYPLWAVTAAFGDNLITSAQALAATFAVTDSDLEALKELGIYINYNSYGNSIEDLHLAPEDLYQSLVGFESPLTFLADNQQDTFQQLKNGYAEDMAKVNKLKPEFENNTVAVYLLPDVAWARRVSGTFGNHLANANPAKAHAVITENSKNGYLVSVRSPLNNPAGADEFCSGFATGGGRKSAAGINHLPKESLSGFIGRFSNFYQTRAP